MKKIICLLLSGVMLIGLVACGNQKDNTNATEQEKPAIEVNREDLEFYDFWELRENVKTPKLKDIDVVDYELDGKPIHKSTTFLSFDKEKICDDIKQNSYWRNVFQNIYTGQSEYHTTSQDDENGNPIMVTYESDRVIGEDSDGSASLIINAEKTMYFYDTPSSIKIEFWDISEDSFNQDEIYDVAKKIYGEEMANYIVYAEDSDFLNWDKEDILENGSCLETTFDVNVGRYAVSRRIKKYDENVSVELSVALISNKYENCYEFSIQDKSNIYEDKENCFTPVNVMTGNCPELSPLNSKEFCEYILKDTLPSFNHSNTYEWEYFEYTDEQNKHLVELYIDINCYDKNGERIGSVGYDMCGEEKDGKILEQDLYISIYTDEIEGMETKAYTDLCSKIGKKMFSDFEVGELKPYEESETELENDDFILKINNIECEGRLSIDAKDGRISFSASSY